MASDTPLFLYSINTESVIRLFICLHIHLLTNRNKNSLLFLLLLLFLKCMQVTNLYSTDSAGFLLALENSKSKQ